jgi:RNA-directed DNA polymerase
VNTGELWPSLDEARARVLSIQTKLHQWSAGDPGRRFDDLFNLVSDPAFLLVAWDRVRSNRGARSAGIDGIVPRSVVFGDSMLRGLRAQLKAQSFEPLPVKERLIPKTAGKFRRLGIPAVRDRIVQASLKLVLEPIFEADFRPCSYGFRPRRRPHDAIAEIHVFASKGYTWVLEGDIEACFDEISHPVLMDRVRDRIGDRRVVRLVKAFLCAGVLSEDGVSRDTKMGTPQGGILSPLLANIALSVLDDHFAGDWERDMATRTERAKRRRHGHPTYRLVRYADDFVVLVHGTEAHAEGLRGEAAAILAPMGLRLSEHKTLIAHIDEGFEFLGFRIQRQQQQGSNKRYVYTWPSKKSVASVRAKVKAITRMGTNQPLSELLRRINQILRGWTSYFQHGVSSRTFSHVHQYTWKRIVHWLRRKHKRATWKWLKRRYLANNWWPEHDEVSLFNCGKVPITRYRYRGAKIPTPWAQTSTAA